MDELRILLLEDDEIDQMAFRRLVKEEQLPYDYVIAASIEAARAALQAQPFDVVLADYHLEDGTVFDLIDIIDDKPIIFITGTGDTDSAIRAMKAGAYDYLVKDIRRDYLKVLSITVDNAIKRWKAEQQVLEMVKERAQRDTLTAFIRDASHDLRTPLAALGLSVDVLDRYTDQLADKIRQGASQEDVQDHLAKIKGRTRQIWQQHKHLGQIILAMLEMVRLDNMTSVGMAVVDLNELVSQVAAGFTNRAHKKSQQLHFEPSPEPAPVTVNKEEFGLAIHNLLDNALIFTPEEGTISVRVMAEAEQVRVIVEDNGVGIAPEDIGQIFKRFYRANQARTMSAESPGGGLGLAIVKRVVDLHHGSIEVESAPGEGSTFTVRLPRANS